MPSLHRLSSRVGLAVILVAGGLYAASASGVLRGVDDHEEPIEMSRIPNPVQAAAKKFFPDLAGCKASMEKEKGQTLFEIEGKGESAMNVTVLLTAAGQVVEVERELPVDRLPSEARAELEKRHPGATLSKVESVEKHRFEVKLVDSRGKETRVELSATGRISGDEDDEEGEEEEGEKR